LLFQPAEESPASGAPEIISAGGLKDVAAAFGLHCAPHLPAGVAGVRPGQAAAAADRVEVTLTGPGGHTARPHLSVDLVHALGRVIVNVPSLLYRRTDPRAGISLVWGTARAGDAYNAIPVEGDLSGNVHSLDREAWQEAPKLITSLIQEVASATGARAEVRYLRGVPPVVNDLAAAQAIAAAARAALGPDQVVDDRVSLAGNGFAYYLEHVPGALVRLGTAGPGVTGELHRGYFDVDERAIEAGIRVLLHTVLAWFADDGRARAYLSPSPERQAARPAPGVGGDPASGQARSEPSSARITVCTSSFTPTPMARSSTSKLPWCRSRSCPSIAVPSLAIAPGTCPRYQEKSSPPMLCGTSAAASGPNAAMVAPVRVRTAPASLTTGGRPRWYSTSATAPVGATSSSTTLVTRPAACAQVARSSTRTVPATRPSVGIVPGSPPAWSSPKTTSRPPRVSVRRLSTAGNSVTTRPSASIRSTLWCGRAGWPPGPRRVTVRLSAAAVS